MEAVCGQTRRHRAGIPYAVLSLPDPGSAPVAPTLLQWTGFRRSSKIPFFESFERLGLEVPVFYWLGRDREFGQAIDTVRPLHMLITNSGRILCKWLGTSENPAIRERMANQIVSDVLWFYAVLLNMSSRGAHP